MTSVEEPAGQFFSQDKIARVNNSTAAVAMESESVETEEVCLEVSHRGEKEGDGTVPKAVFELEMSGEGGPSADATARELFRADSLVHVDRQIVDVDIYNMNRAESLALRHKGYTKRQALLWMILQLVCLLYNVFVTPVQICYLNYNILNGRNTKNLSWFARGSMVVMVLPALVRGGMEWGRLRRSHVHRVPALRL